MLLRWCYIDTSVQYQRPHEEKNRALTLKQCNLLLVNYASLVAGSYADVTSTGTGQHERKISEYEGKCRPSVMREGILTTILVVLTTESSPDMC